MTSLAVRPSTLDGVVFSGLKARGWGGVGAFKSLQVIQPVYVCLSCNSSNDHKMLALVEIWLYYGQFPLEAQNFPQKNLGSQ